MNQRHLLTALLLPACIQAAAQQVRISDFRQVSAADSERYADLASPVRDADGEACAVLVLETGESGWTFEAGLAGIVDVQSREGQVRVWLPSGGEGALGIASPPGDAPQLAHPRVDGTRSEEYSTTLIDSMANAQGILDAILSRNMDVIGRYVETI